MVSEFDKQGAGHGLLPREIVTARPIDNSMILDMAMGGSTNTRAAHAGGRPRGRRGLRHGADQRSQPPDAQHLQGRAQQQLSRRGRPQRRRHTHDPGQHPARAARDCWNSIAPPSAARRWARTSPTSTSAPPLSGQEALELAAVTAGGRRTSEGMGVRRQAASIRRIVKRGPGLRPAAIASARSRTPTAPRAVW